MGAPAIAEQEHKIPLINNTSIKERIAVMSYSDGKFIRGLLYIYRTGHFFS
jgi:hypothetical protein